MNTQPQERNQDATIYVGGLDDKVTEPLLWELMLQAGPVVNVHMPKDRVTGSHQNYGFVEFLSEEDAECVQGPLSASLAWGGGLCALTALKSLFAPKGLVARALRPSPLVPGVRGADGCLSNRHRPPHLTAAVSPGTPSKSCR